jgi:hypothetical protein
MLENCGLPFSSSQEYLDKIDEILQECRLEEL